MQPSRSRRTFRPGLEQLEDRKLCAVFTVTNGNDTGAGSLRAAVAAAQANAGADVVRLKEGLVVTLKSGLEINTSDALVMNASGATIQRSSAPGTANFRLLRLAAGSNVRLGGITFANGHVVGENGGGILNEGSVHLSGITFRDNSAVSASGTGGLGGGLYNAAGGSLTVHFTKFETNSADQGGGLANAGNMYLEADFTGNHATVSGGGLMQSGTGILYGNTFEDNTSDGTGGAIAVDGGSIEIGGAVVIGNHAANGGGFSVAAAGTLSLHQNTIANNTATQNGGAVYNAGGDAHLHNVTISLNRADSDNDNSGTGGGVFSTGTHTELFNTIVSGDFRGSGLTANDVEADSALGGDHNLIGVVNAAAGITNGVNGNLVGVDPKLGPLRDNGGDTLTFALLPGSPAIDAGFDDPFAIGAPHELFVDQRGLGRVSFGAIDIGAYERAPTVFVGGGSLALVDNDNVANNLIIRATATSFVIRDTESLMWDAQGNTSHVRSFLKSDFNKLIVSLGGGIDRVTFDYSDSFLNFSEGTTVRGVPAEDTLLAKGDTDFRLTQDRLIVGNHTKMFVETIGKAVLQGGAGDNRLDARGFEGTAVLDGGAGNDVLIGGTHRNILIGGLGTDNLVGDDDDNGPQAGDDDILIGGRTTLNLFDADFIPLIDKWASDLAYAVRVRQIRNGTGLPVGVKLVAAKVPDDGARDVLAGKRGLDWFWAYDNDLVKDKAAGEFIR